MEEKLKYLENEYIYYKMQEIKLSSQMTKQTFINFWLGISIFALLYIIFRYLEHVMAFNTFNTIVCVASFLAYIFLFNNYINSIKQHSNDIENKIFSLKFEIDNILSELNMSKNDYYKKIDLLIQDEKSNKSFLRSRF